MTLLTEKQLSDWHRDGFLVLPEFVSEDSCRELQAHAVGQLESADPSLGGALTVFSTADQGHGQDEWFLTSGDKSRWFLEEGAVTDGALNRPLPLAVNKLGHAMHDLDPVFGRFSRTPDLAAIASEIGFSDPRLLQSMYIFKQPGIGGEVTCHCDHTFLWTNPMSVVGFWFAIEDATLDNGCLWAAPGGHLGTARTRFRRQGEGTITDVVDSTPWPTDDLVPLEAEAGTMVLLHGLLPHWSAPNRSATSRHAYTLHVIEGEADYPADNWLQRSPELPLRGFRD